MGGTGIEDDFIVINTFGVFGYFEGLQSNPSRVKVKYNPDWTVGTALLPDEDGYYVARFSLLNRGAILCKHKSE